MKSGLSLIAGSAIAGLVVGEDLQISNKLPTLTKKEARQPLVNSRSHRARRSPKNDGFFEEWTDDPDFNRECLEEFCNFQEFTELFETLGLEGPAEEEYKYYKDLQVNSCRMSESNKNSDKILCDPQGSAACEQHLGYRKCVCNSFVYTDPETGIKEALPAFTSADNYVSLFNEKYQENDTGRCDKQVDICQFYVENSGASPCDEGFVCVNSELPSSREEYSAWTGFTCECPEGNILNENGECLEVDLWNAKCDEFLESLGDEFTQNNLNCFADDESPTGISIDSANFLFDWSQKSNQDAPQLNPKACEDLEIEWNQSPRNNSFCQEFFGLENGQCVDQLDGPVTCECPTGWAKELLNEGASICVKSGPCESDPCSGYANAFCVEVNESEFECQCEDGYQEVEEFDQYDGSIIFGCAPIPPPTTTTEEPEPEPTPSCPSFNQHYSQSEEKCVCSKGWVLNADNTTCVDDNECDTDSYAGRYCSQGQYCKNYVGGYMCYNPTRKDLVQLTCHHRAEPVSMDHPTIRRNEIVDGQILTGFDVCSCFDTDAYQSRCYGSKCFLVGWREESWAYEQVLNRATEEFSEANPEMETKACGTSKHVAYNDGCYYYYSEEKTVPEAEEFCSQYGGVLATIDSRELWYLLGTNRDLKFSQSKDKPFWMSDSEGLRSVETRRGKRGLKMFTVGESRLDISNKGYAFVSTMQDTPSLYVVDRTEAKFSFFCKTNRLVEQVKAAPVEKIKPVPNANIVDSNDYNEESDEDLVNELIEEIVDEIIDSVEAVEMKN